MWTLNNNELGQTALINNSTVRGLELFEVLEENIPAPLFRYQPLSTYGVSTSATPGQNTGSPDVTPVIEPDLTHSNEYYLYVIDNIWELPSLQKVPSVNLLAQDTYVYYDNKTYVMLAKSETSLSLETEFYAYLPQANSAYQYEFEVDVFDPADVTEVTFSGLVFNPSGNLTFQAIDNTLILNANKYCRPNSNDLGTIKVSKTATLSDLPKFLVYEFDLSNTNVKVATYLEYKGKNYNQSRNIEANSLINNFQAKKVYALT